MFRSTFTLVYEQRGLRLRNLTFQEKGDRIYINWKVSGVFTFLPLDSDMKTAVQHISGEKADLAEEDKFDGSKGWEVVENYNQLKAQLKVGKALTRILDLFAPAFQDKVKKQWAENKDFIQAIANEQHQQQAEDGADKDSGSSVGPATDPGEATPAAKQTRAPSPPSAPPAQRRYTMKSTSAKTT